MNISVHTAWVNRMDGGTLLGRKFHFGVWGSARAEGARSYKTIAIHCRFEFDDLSEYQIKNPAVENELNVRRFS